LAVLPWNSPVMPELRKMTASAPLVQLAAAWEELHPAICMVFRRSKGAVAVRETTPASAPLTKTAVADPPEPSLSLNADISPSAFSAFSDSVRPTHSRSRVNKHLASNSQVKRSGIARASNSVLWGKRGVYSTANASPQNRSSQAVSGAKTKVGYGPENS
jgi:hypothetical protein